MKTSTGIIASIAVSVIALYLSLAPFTPAIFVSFCMFPVAGFYAWQKFTKTALALLVVNSIAIYWFIDLVSQPGVSLG